MRTALARTVIVPSMLVALFCSSLAHSETLDHIQSIADCYVAQQMLSAGATMAGNYKAERAIDKMASKTLDWYSQRVGVYVQANPGSQADIAPLIQNDINKYKHMDNQAQRSYIEQILAANNQCVPGAY